MARMRNTNRNNTHNNNSSYEEACKQRVEENLKRFQSIPSYFMRKYLPKVKTSISLIDPKGRPWEVILLRTSHGSFLGGWIAFSLGNNLREGDVCMFELVGECQMRVHIFKSKMPPLTPVKSSEKTKSLMRASHF